jgi:hypothetical protein
MLVRGWVLTATFVVLGAAEGAAAAVSSIPLPDSSTLGGLGLALKPVSAPACPVVAGGVHDDFALAKKSPSRSWGGKPLCCHTVKAALREEKREAANCPNRTLSPCTPASDRGKPCLACMHGSGLIVEKTVDANEGATCLAA